MPPLHSNASRQGNSTPIGLKLLLVVCCGIAIPPRMGDPAVDYVQKDSVMFLN